MNYEVFDSTGLFRKIIEAKSPQQAITTAKNKLHIYAPMVQPVVLKEQREQEQREEWVPFNPKRAKW